MAGRKLVGALLAATVVAGALVASPASGAVSDVAPACPAGTTHSELVGGDDFAPATAPSATWEYEPAGRFGVEQDASASDGWLMHGGYADDGAGAFTRMTSRIQLPEGRRLVLQLDHSFELADGTGAWMSINANYTNADENPWPVLDLTGSDDGYFRGSASGMTSTADLSALAGRTVWLTLTLGEADPAATQAGWDVDGFSIHTCDDDQPSAPTAVVTKPGFTAIDSTWQPPGWRPEDVDGYQVRLIDLADATRNQTVDLPADARSWRFTGLTPGRSYRVQVGTGGRFTAGPRLTGSTAPLAVPASQVVNYPGDGRIAGLASCADNNYFVPVLVQRRYRSTATWVDFARTASSGRGWSKSFVPLRHTEYRALVQPGKYGERTCMGRITQTVKVRVRLAVLAGAPVNPVYTPDPVVIKGSVRPAHDGMQVYLQRYRGGSWYTVSSQRLSSDSAFRFAFRKNPGRYYYRVFAPTHSDHLGAASPRIYVNVREG